MTVQGYDLVGDIHGHADALHRLLRALDYVEIEGVFRRSERQMIFVGDFIDRGPQQREVRFAYLSDAGNGGSPSSFRNAWCFAVESRIGAVALETLQDSPSRAAGRQC
jgi:hypothetical protein